MPIRAFLVISTRLRAVFVIYARVVFFFFADVLVVFPGLTVRWDALISIFLQSTLASALITRFPLVWTAVVTALGIVQTQGFGANALLLSSRRGKFFLAVTLSCVRTDLPRLLVLSTCRDAASAIVAHDVFAHAPDRIFGAGEASCAIALVV